MSQGAFPSRWFLELDGKRMGPFSPEQVLGLLADGEIPDNLHVYPDPKLGAFPEFSGSMTAASLREAYFHDHRIPPAPDMAGSDSIPDAPEPTPDHLTSGDGGQDLATARRLFDLFQSAKEKRAARFAPSVVSQETPSSNGTSQSRVISIAATAAVLVVSAVWGFSRSSDPSTPDPSREIAAQASKTQATPASTESSRVTPAAELKRESPVVTAAPAVKTKSSIRNAWKPGKSVAKVIPHSSSRDDRREERRDDRRYDDRDDRRYDDREDRRDDRRYDRADDRRDDRRDEPRDERNQDQWNQAQDPNGAPVQATTTPLVNQMATDAGLQPPPAVPNEGYPQEGQPQNGTFTEQPAQ